MFFGLGRPATLPTPEEALPGRAERIPVPATHAVTGAPMEGPWKGMEVAYFGMGCFWGAERRFWQTEGVVSTAAGYQGGFTENPTYKEVCSGGTGHTEVVQVVFDPTRVSYEALLKLFFESHDPTQGMRQGNDRGTQYRSAIFTTTAMQLASAESAQKDYGKRLAAAGYGRITTEIRDAPRFYYAEEYHQQYLAPSKNPNGYCGLSGTGVSCPIGLDV
jgi:peptide-methionine (S)-S-oxide reductase